MMPKEVWRLEKELKAEKSKVAKFKKAMRDVIKQADNTEEDVNLFLLDRIYEMETLIEKNT